MLDAMNEGQDAAATAAGGGDRATKNLYSAASGTKMREKISANTEDAAQLEAMRQENSDRRRCVQQSPLRMPPPLL